MKYISALCMGLVVLSLCACTRPVRTPEQQAFMDELLNRPVTCKGQKDCDDKWDRATQWVVKHSKLGIRKVTSRTILTYSDRESGTNIGHTEFEVVKFKDGDHYVFNFRTSCDYFACTPTGKMLRVDFINFIMGLPPGVTQVGPNEFHKEIHH